MKAKTLHNIANYVMVGAPIYCYATITEQEHWIVALVAVVAFATYYKDHLGVVWLKGAAYKIAMMLGLAYGVFDIYRRDTGLFIVSVANTLVVVQLIGLLQEHTRTSYRLMVLIALVLLATCSALTTEFFFAAVFFVFALAATLSLMLRLIVECTETTDSVRGQRAGRAGTGLVALAFMVTMVTMILAGVIFAVFPRVSPGFLAKRRPSGRLTTVSGFSDSIQLNDIGQILDNRTPVMYVALERDGRPYRPSNVLDLNWRGVALAYFDGRGWSRSADKDLFNNSSVSSHAYYKLKRRPDRNEDAAHLIKQDIIMEPLEFEIIFGLDRPVCGYQPEAAESAEGGARRLGILQNLYDHSLVREEGGTGGRIHYIIYSDVRKPSAEALKKDAAVRRRDTKKLTPLEQSYLLECLDTTHVSDRMKELARKIVGEREKTSDYEVVEKIRKYFAESDEYEYTLDVNMPEEAESPIETFLFDKKEGHCELYASALALLIRCRGIPARIVNGFKGGSWDKINHRYVVAQHHAHAWVEVLFKQAGWVPFDGVPASSSHYDTNRREMGWYNGLLLWARLAWSRYIVGFDKTKQLEFFKGLKNTQKQLTQKLDAVLARNRKLLKELFTERRMSLRDVTPGSVTTLILAGLVVLAGVLAAFSFLKRLHPGMSYKVPGRGAYSKTAIQIMRVYYAVLKKLRTRGLDKRPSQTALEFVASAVDRGAVGTEIEELTYIFCRARYGGRVGPAEYRRARELARAVGLPSG